MAAPVHLLSKSYLRDNPVSIERVLLPKSDLKIIKLRDKFVEANKLLFDLTRSTKQHLNGMTSPLTSREIYSLCDIFSINPTCYNNLWKFFPGPDGAKARLENLTAMIPDSAKYVSCLKTFKKASLLKTEAPSEEKTCSISQDIIPPKFYCELDGISFDIRYLLLSIIEDNNLLKNPITHANLSEEQILRLCDQLQIEVEDFKLICSKTFTFNLSREIAEALSTRQQRGFTQFRNEKQTLVNTEERKRLLISLLNSSNPFLSSPRITGDEISEISPINPDYLNENIRMEFKAITEALLHELGRN
jgi:hypothetical protein